MRFFVLLITLIVCLGCSTLFAEDVARFRGDDSQGKYNETGLMKTWPKEGLTPKWVIRDIGEGWSSVVKIKDRLFLNCIDQDDSKKESILCLDLDGKKIWQQQLGSIWTASYPSPRATPTYVAGEKPQDDKLVMLCGGGELFCVASADGQILWRKDIVKTYEMRPGHWGTSESVVVKDGVIYITSCGKKTLAVALNVADGSEVWQSPTNDDISVYVAPTIIDNQLIIVTAAYVSVLDIKTGKLLCRENYKQVASGDRYHETLCTSPLVNGNQFLVTSGYDQGGIMYEILPDGKGLKQLWISKTLDNHHGGVVEYNGRIYGSNWVSNSSGNWVCIDWKTGETVYENPWERLGKGAIILADDMLYLYEERRGTLGLMSPDDEFKVVSSFQIDFGSKEHWAHPVICDGVLYVRHGNSLGAFDIKE